MDHLVPVKLEHYYGRPQEDPFQWVESFELFLEVTQASEDRVLRLLKYALREDAYRWFRANEADLQGWEECKGAFLERFGYDEDTITSRLYACCQQPNEAVRSYADRLRNLICYLSNPLPPRMLAQMFIKGLVPPLRERVQMMCPLDSQLAEIIKLAANYEQIFGVTPLGGHPDRPVPLMRPVQENPRNNDRPPPPQQREGGRQQENNNNPRPWNNNRNRDTGDRRSNNNPQGGGAPPPPREILPVPAKPDVDVLTREMERLRIQIAELQKPTSVTANFTQFEEEPATVVSRPPYESFHQRTALSSPAHQLHPIAEEYANKRTADGTPDSQPTPLRRRPNNVEDAAVDPAVPFNHTPSGPPPQRPGRADEQERGPPPATPPEAPRRAAPVRQAADLGGLPPLPERPAYRRAAAAPQVAAEPIQQIKALPMKLNVQTYLNHVSEEEFDRAMREMMEGRQQYLRGRQPAPPPQAPRAEAHAAAGSTAENWEPMEFRRPLSQNLQRNPVTTSVATVPIVINNVIFEDGVLDTGATNTMISQTTARQLDLLDSIEPCRVKFSCADGNSAAPWGKIRRLSVGVDGFTIPLDVYVSGATTYDVLLGTDWLTQAKAEISFEKSELTFRIDPHIVGKIPISVNPNRPTTKDSHFCVLLQENGGAAGEPHLQLMEYSSSEAEDSSSDTDGDLDDSPTDTDDSPAESTSGESDDFDSSSDEEPEWEEEYFLQALVDTMPEFAPPEDDSAAPAPDPDTFMLRREYFMQIEDVMGPFDFQAGCEEDGTNAVIPNVLPLPSPGAEELLWTHQNVYCQPPIARIQDALEYSKKNYDVSPGTTSAAFVIPDWPDAAWYPMVQEYFETLFRYPEGRDLFTAPGLTPTSPRRSAGPTLCPYLIIRTPRRAPGLDNLKGLAPVDFDYEDPTVDQPPLEVPLGDQLSAEENNYLRAVLREYRDVFTPGVSQQRTTLMYHRIDTGNAAPIQARPYRLAKSEDKIISEEVQNMLKAGVIVPSNSPWSSAPVLVGKPDGSIRFCIDYRALNAVTTRDNYPMPRVDEALDSMSQGVKYLSKIDCKSAFWLIPMAPEDRAKTAFITRDGLYEFISMPFGLRNAPATLQRFVNTLLSDLIGKCCFIYLDDCLIFSKTFDDHIRHICDILDRFRAVGFRANPSKCELFVQELLFLGHILTSSGIRPNPAKTQVIQEALPPTNVTEVKSFLGLAGYYRRFIPNMASLSAPLTRLTKKNMAFEWTPDCAQAFEAIKKLLVRAPLLRHPDFTKEFTLYTDWQPGAAAAILGQRDEEGEYVIAYASRTLAGPELNYSPTDGELLAVVWAIRYFRPYLYGTHFHIVTDHKALQWLLTTRNLTGKLSRYAVELQDYDFDIQYRAGTLHGNVDGLSRLRLPPTNEHEGEELLTSKCFMLRDEGEDPPEKNSAPTLAVPAPLMSYSGARVFEFTLPSTFMETQPPEGVSEGGEAQEERAETGQTPPAGQSTPRDSSCSQEDQEERRAPSAGLDNTTPVIDKMSNTICQVCLAPDDAETMLLCDTCDHGYHIDCLDPPLCSVSRGP
jgi:hypothetical protein